MKKTDDDVHSHDEKSNLPKVRSDASLSLTSSSDEETKKMLETWLSGGEEPPVKSDITDTSDIRSAIAASAISPAGLPPRNPPVVETAGSGDGDQIRGPKSVLKKTVAPEQNQFLSGAAFAAAAVAGQDQAKILEKPTSWHHLRNVSWGANQQGGLPPLELPPPARPSAMTDAEAFRSYSDMSSLPDDTRPELPGLNQTMSDSSSAKRRDPKVVNLNDILKVNPIESEAETLILKAIEKQDALNDATKGNRPRANTGLSTTSNLLSNVPHEALGIFTPSTPPRGPNVDPTSTTRTPTSPRLVSMPQVKRAENRRFTSTSSASPSSEQRSGSPGNIKQPKNLSIPTHQRTQTMEQTLAGLTMALDGHNRLDEHTIIKNDKKPERETIAPSSGLTLAKNASIILGGRQKTGSGPDSGTSGQPPRAATNWGKVRNHVNATHHRESSGLGLSHSSSGSKANLVQQPSEISTLGSQEKPSSNGNFMENIHPLKEANETLDDMEAGAAEVDDATSPNGDGSDHVEITGRKYGRKRESHFGSNAFTKSSVKSGFIGDLQTFAFQKRDSFLRYLRFYLLVASPATAVAFVLFYAFDNPPTGKVDLSMSVKDLQFREVDGALITPKEASASWWILFVCVRQALTFSLAQFIQVLVIDFFCLSTRISVNMFGNLVTLLVVQSRGWPFTLLVWALLDFGLLHGPGSFANHWLFMQDFANIFNQSNPSGSVTENLWNTRILLIAVIVSALAAVKRLWLGLTLGKKTFSNYAEDLAKIVKKLIILSDVGALGRKFLIESLENNVQGSSSKAPSIARFGITRDEFDNMVRSHAQQPPEDGESSLGSDESYQGGRLINPVDVDQDGDISHSQQTKIDELLGAWEEPEESMAMEEDISISGILQFRHSLSYLESRFMFSIAFGDVSRRNRMVVSSQNVYQRLLLKTPGQTILNFETLALTAMKSNGTLDQEKLKDLIRLLRPDRDGNLSLLEFVKSVDAVYKEARLLRASVKNSEKIDRAFENAFNVLFYTITACVVLSQIGFNPLALFLSLSSIILGFAFMIGSASSKLFEGWLFILLRRPYDIGDKIHISNPESDTSPSGSASWVVKDVNLFSTTVVFATTGERATLSNGSLANSRVINMARSPNANLYVYLKFSTSVPYERVKIFEQALTQFIKARPRQWASLLGFRATQVHADLGYIEYVIVLEHRDRWQNIVTLLVSKAEVSSFCLELMKKLDMRYRSPPLPVDLALTKDRAQDDADLQSTVAKFGLNSEDSGFKELTALFESKKDK